MRAGNGRESIVPNESLITSRVENLSLADRKFNITTTIVVGYDSDVAQVQAILCDAAAAQPRVLTDPAPVAFLMTFAPDGLEFTLNFWVADPDKGKDNVRSAINIAILDGLRARGHRHSLSAARAACRVVTSWTSPSRPCGSPIITKSTTVLFLRPRRRPLIEMNSARERPAPKIDRLPCKPRFRNSMESNQ